MNCATGSAAAAVTTKSPIAEHDRRPEGRRTDLSRRRLGLHERGADAHVGHRRGERREHDGDRRRTVVRGSQEARKHRDREQAAELDRDLAAQLPLDACAHEALHARSSVGLGSCPYDCPTDARLAALPNGVAGQKIRRRRAVRLASPSDRRSSSPNPALSPFDRASRSDAVVMLQLFAIAVMVFPSDTVIQGDRGRRLSRLADRGVRVRRVLRERPARLPRSGAPLAPDPRACSA